MASHVVASTVAKQLPVIAAAPAPAVGHLTLPSLSQQSPAPAILNRLLLSSSSCALCHKSSTFLHRRLLLVDRPSRSSHFLPCVLLYHSSRLHSTLLSTMLAPTIIFFLQENGTTPTALSFGLLCLFPCAKNYNRNPRWPQLWPSPSAPISRQQLAFPVVVAAISSSPAPVAIQPSLLRAPLPPLLLLCSLPSLQPLLLQQQLLPLSVVPPATVTSAPMTSPDHYYLCINIEISTDCDCLVLPQPAIGVGTFLKQDLFSPLHETWSDTTIRNIATYAY
ncbi:hypothetical protein GW17_00026901, partial [Ensete ventricosum]